MKKVILIGGAPMCGKTTLARAVAARYGYCCIPVDDIGQAVSAYVPDDEINAPMKGHDYREYYLHYSTDQLIEHARKQHEALWKSMKPVITAHLEWGHPAVIEGWGLYPGKVREIDSSNMISLWLVAAKAVLEKRIRENSQFYEGASDTEGMINSYLERSVWHNGVIEKQARQLKMIVVEIKGNSSEKDVFDECVRELEVSEKQ